MECAKDHRTPRQIALFERMADEIPLDRQRELLAIADTDVSTTDLEQWQRELVDELRQDDFFAETVRASIPVEA